jgi:phage protein D
MVKQDNQESDYEFIKNKLAKEIEFEFFMRENILNFRPPDNHKKSFVTTLKWGQSLFSFSPRLNIANQVSEVRVHHWNPKDQQAIVGIARRGQERGRDRGERSGGERLDQVQSGVIKHVWQPVSSQDEAEQIAKSILNKLADELLTGSGECIGIPEILPGKNIKVEGVGEKYSKTYYIESTTHSMSTSGYKTTFNVKEKTYEFD